MRTPGRRGDPGFRPPVCGCGRTGAGGHGVLRIHRHTEQPVRPDQRPSVNRGLQPLGTKGTRLRRSAGDNAAAPGCFHSGTIDAPMVRGPGAARVKRGRANGQDTASRSVTTERQRVRPLEAARPLRRARLHRARPGPHSGRPRTERRSAARTPRRVVSLRRSLPMAQRPHCGRLLGNAAGERPLAARRSGIRGVVFERAKTNA